MQTSLHSKQILMMYLKINLKQTQELLEASTSAMTHPHYIEQ